MAMTKQTAAGIEKAKEFFGDREFKEREWEWDIFGVTLETVLKWKGAKRIVRIKREYYTIKELVGMLNSCSGNDCYDCDWNLKIDEDGRAYEDHEVVTYKMT